MQMSMQVGKTSEQQVVQQETSVQTNTGEHHSYYCKWDAKGGSE
jgi:hypothetical protein